MVGHQQEREIPPMRNLVSLIVAVGLAAVFAGPAFAADAPKTKADCVKANMKWHFFTQKCTPAK